MGVIMDRLSGDLVRRTSDGNSLGISAIPLNNEEEFFLRASNQRLGIPEKLFALEELDVLYDAEQRALWTYMRPSGRPSFTPPLLADFEQWQQFILQGFGSDRTPLDFLVLGSRAPGVFCYGGDLQLFAELIRAGNRAGLVAYGKRCVEILNLNRHGLNLPVVTIGLVQGQALGGGFEALLSFDFIIAERGSMFGLPEVIFGLFPGMGAHALLSRKLGTAIADRMILSDQTYSAEQLYDLGIVHQLAEPGQGVDAVRSFMAKSQRRHSGLVASRRAMRIASPIAMAEFYEIVELWADAALQLSEKDLKLMQRLASAQERQAKAA